MQKRGSFMFYLFVIVAIAIFCLLIFWTLRLDSTKKNIKEITLNNITAKSIFDDYSVSPLENTSQIYENKQPYLTVYCDKINPYDLSIREASSKAIQGNPGAYNIHQVLDIYDWMKLNIFYQNVPFSLDDSPYLPNETLQTKSGDCKNQAVLLASMINSVGGTAEVMLNPSCNHAYVLVYFTSNTSEFNDIVNVIKKRYNKFNIKVNNYFINGSYWGVFDTAGGDYPGDLFNKCIKSDKVYSVSSCVTKIRNTLRNTLCHEGYILGNDNLCHLSCGDSYCITGTCFNGKCVACPIETVLGQDGQCHEICGNKDQYCFSGFCCDGSCTDCSTGFILGQDCLCHKSL